MKFSGLFLAIASATTATAADDTVGNLRRSAKDTASSSNLERHLGGPNDNGPCNGICNAFEKACGNDCEGGGGNGKGCTRLCEAQISFMCTCEGGGTTTPPPPVCSDLTVVGTDTSVWDSSTPGDAPNGIFPIGGSGQIAGEFTLLTEDSVEVGIRAQERRIGPVTPTDNGAGVGVYAVDTGYDLTPTVTNDRNWWNFDLHLDLRATTTTLGDYSQLVLTADCIAGTCDGWNAGVTVGTGYRFNLVTDFSLPPNTALLQVSYNMLFGAPWTGSYDLDAEATYKFCLLLGDLCPVCMEVVATAPAGGSTFP